MLLLMIILYCFLAVKAKSNCTILYDSKYKGPAADCTNRNLRTVPSDLPTSIVLLQLGGNRLDQVHAYCFQTYPELKEVDLSENDISRFENESFSGLSHLITLNLWRNRISMDTDTFPPSVFKPLRSLQYLYLNKSKIESKQGDFPGDVFKDLIHLEELSVDTWPESHQRSRMRNLRSLHTLRIDGVKYCHMTHIENKTFAALENIPVVDLRLHCWIRQIDTNVLSPFKNLQILELHTTYSSSLSMSKVTSLLKPFVDKRLVTVDLSTIQNIRDESNIDRVLNKETMSYLLHICVERLSLSNNKITTVSSNILQVGILFRCLKYLDLSHNHITSQMAVIFEMNDLENLEYLDLSNNYGSLLTNTSKTHYSGSHLWIGCPPKLRFLLLHHSGHTNEAFNINVTFYNCSSLFELDISHTGYYDFNGYLSGLSALGHLDISQNTIWESVFSNTDAVLNLETLIARGTIMKFDILTSEAFFSMKKLRTLDLSSTNLQTILPDTFTQLPKLGILILSGNRFDGIPDELTQIKSLQQLDLSHNVIRTIPPGARDKLDNLNGPSSSFQLMLQGNTFLCSCATLDFIAWIKETEIHLDNNRNFSCIKDDGTMSDTESFYSGYVKEWRKCIGKTWLFISTIGQFLLILSLIVTFLVEKYLPKIEYFILTTLGYVTEELPCRENCRYDAYICYDDNRYWWPVHNLLPNLKKIDSKIRLYLPDLHEAIGGVKAESIIEALRVSWKVVIIISGDSFTDEWFYYSVLSAVRLFSTSTITSRIIILYKDVTPEVKDKTPQSLVNIVSQQNVFDVKDGSAFWEELHSLIMEEKGPDVFF